MRLVSIVSARRMLRKIIVTIVYFCLVACREPQQPLTFQQSLPLSRGVPFDVLVDDVNDDGRRDIAVVSHGDNFMQVFYQQEGRSFRAGPEISEVGFHPGMIAPWPKMESGYLLNAEGASALRLLQVGPDQTFSAVRAFTENSPRYSVFFSWPGWGTGLAVSPFHYDTFVLWKNLDFDMGRQPDRYAMSLSARGHSNLTAGKPIAVDIDGDEVEEIIFAVHRNHELRKVRRPQEGTNPTAELLYRFQRGAQAQVVALDVNDDGASDLLVPDQTAPFEIHLLLNDGHGVFSQSRTFKFPTTMGIRAIDVGQDKDGIKTMIAVGYGALVLYRFPHGWNGKSDVPEIVQSFPPFEASQSITLRDIDGDGWLDTVVGRGTARKGVWLAFGPLEKNFHTLIERKFYFQ